MSGKQSNLLFVDPKLHYPIRDLHLNFHHYTQECKKIIIKGRIDLATDEEIIIDANTPFEYRPSGDKKIKYGALLIHGLFDSPFMMRDVGARLCAEGLLVRSILLPGHGTVPGALLNVDYHQWLQAVNYGVSSFANEVEKLFLVGFSTGGILALHHAAQHPSIAGIIMLSPALKILSPFAFISKWPPKLSPIWPRANWFCQRKEIDYAKYQSIPFNAIYQLYLLSKEVRQTRFASWANCPLFMILSEQDEVVSSQACLDFFAQLDNQKNHLLIYSDRERTFADERITLRNSSYPDLDIINFSHITLPIDPNNFHYGKTGDYCYASHDHNDKYIYGAFSRGQVELDNFLYRYKLIQQRERRLTYNPDFEFLSYALRKFITAV